MAKIFSLPLNPKLSETQFAEFVEFCDTYKDFISDIYFTCRIPPFTQDAMGDVFLSDDDPQFMIDAALYIQERTGITVSATCNNISVRPTQENLDLWIEAFKPIYARGVRLCTLPFNHWLMTGQIQKEFPELEVRSSILMDTKTPTDVYNVSSPPIEMHQSPPCLIDSSANINSSSSSASSYISTSSNNVSSNRLKRRRLHYSSGSESKYPGLISFKTYYH